LNIKRRIAVIKASHPFSVVMASFAGGIISWKVIGWDFLVIKILLVIVLAQFLTGFVNDYLDYSSDLLYQPTKPTVRNLVNLKDLRLAIQLSIFLLSIASIAFFPLLGIVIVIAGVLVAHSYNMGLKDTPYSALIFVVSFGLMAALPFFVTDSLELDNLPLRFIFSGLLISLSIHLTNDLVDYETDKARQAKPLTVVLGQNNTILTIIVLAIVFALVQIDTLILIILQFGASFAVWFGIKTSSYQGREIVYYIVASLHVFTLYLLPLE
jgi:4-hydroxybenzoate polyprenyltransferase